MAYIETGNKYPGILGLLWYKQSTAKVLSALAETLLRGKSGLSRGERELIAAYVSHLNGCEFCCDSHSAAASCHLSSETVVVDTKTEFERADVSPKMKGLLRIASKVQQGGRAVQRSDVEEARKLGASDEDIHDAVLVTAAFCMFNRYVDGLGTLPAKKTDYQEMGARLAKQGYRQPPFFLRWLVRKILDRKFT